MTRATRLTVWRGRFADPRVTRWLWVAAFALALPAMALSHVLDDLQQQAMVRGTYDSAERTPADLYCFSLGPKQAIDPALLSWWDFDDSGLCFLRPISSASLWLDHKWLWDHPALTHLHAVLWFMLLWFGWRRILLHYLPTDITNLALLLTALSGFATMTVGWIAARHALVGGCFAVWGLYYCFVARDAAEPRARPSGREVLGWSILAVGLLSSEMVLGAIGFLVAREWLVRTESGAMRAGSLARIAGYALCGLAFVATHKTLGYGAPKYPMYLDPTGAPLTFLRAAPERLLALAGDLILGISAELWLYPFLRPFVAAASAFGLFMLIAALRNLFREAPPQVLAPLRWLGAGAVLSLGPCVSGMQGGRTLAIAGFPLFALIAACLLYLPRRSGGAGEPRWYQRNAVRGLALGTLAAGALVLNPLSHLAWYGVLAGLDETGEQALDEAGLDCQTGSDVYLIDASQVGASAWYARFWLKDKLGARHFRQLNMIPSGIESLELARTGPTSLTLRADGGTLLSAMAVPRGTEDRFQAGFSRDYVDFRMQVSQVTPRGPSELSFQLTQPLDHPKVCFFVQDDFRLYQIEPPAEGQSLEIRPPSPLQGTPLEPTATTAPRTPTRPAAAGLGSFASPRQST